MKKFLVVLGSIFLALIVFGAIGIALIAVRGNALDKESKAYADAAIADIVTIWSEKDLLDRASPELKQAATTDDLHRMFRWYSSLGGLQKCEPAQGQAIMQTGKMPTAQYVAKATFQKGQATIKLDLIKHGNQWQILGFYIDSPAFVPP
jgi:hypothetical protein